MTTISAEVGAGMVTGAGSHSGARVCELCSREKIATTDAVAALADLLGTSTVVEMWLQQASFAAHRPIVSGRFVPTPAETERCHSGCPPLKTGAA